MSDQDGSYEFEFIRIKLAMLLTIPAIIAPFLIVQLFAAAFTDFFSNLPVFIFSNLALMAIFCNYLVPSIAKACGKGVLHEDYVELHLHNITHLIKYNEIANFELYHRYNGWYCSYILLTKTDKSKLKIETVQELNVGKSVLLYKNFYYAFKDKISDKGITEIDCGEYSLVLKFGNFEKVKID